MWGNLDTLVEIGFRRFSKNALFFSTLGQNLIISTHAASLKLEKPDKFWSNLDTKVEDGTQRSLPKICKFEFSSFHAFL